MDARDLECRKSRAEASLISLIQRINNIGSLGPNFYSVGAGYLVNGWQEEIMYLPSCELESEVRDTFSIVALELDTSDNRKRFYNACDELCKSLKSKELKSNCREAIKNMR